MPWTASCDTHFLQLRIVLVASPPFSTPLHSVPHYRRARLGRNRWLHSSCIFSLTSERLCNNSDRVYKMQPGPAPPSLSEADIDAVLQSDDFRMYGYKVKLLLICTLSPCLLLPRPPASVLAQLRRIMPILGQPADVHTAACRSCRVRGAMRTIGRPARSTIPARRLSGDARAPSRTSPSRAPI